ncbi:sarcosine oxidase subunit delta [Ancylobacter amanitiformis]|uniref:Sarcosine oxidase subunit delta n=1 Tax=Ancylobacter amanitiformis TaxID=217069 RepID=A0ABU0LNV0_9HYPH|nr:sarcosine oxidase subunit delta [Ancylobacter amanitiformis]MDQ0510362.1 sarcosine oxidase subunit delta [Ancylobacter amanitiformis]
MLIIDCPWCGARPEIEFRYGGEAHIARPADPAAMSDQEWADFLYNRTNPKGLHAERWRHIHGCGRYFNAVRDTVSDFFVTTYKAGEPRPDIGESGK